MCTLTRKTRRKTFTGLKLAVRCLKTGKFYSGSTGIEYKKGKVPDNFKAKRLCERWKESFNNIKIKRKKNKFPIWYNEAYVSYTSVFSDKYSLTDSVSFSCNKAKPGYEEVVLKMTIAGDIWEGRYVDAPIMAGNEILYVEETQHPIP